MCIAKRVTVRPLNCNELEHVQIKNTWEARISNGVFGSYNPYTTIINGDWCNLVLFKGA